MTNNNNRRPRPILNRNRPKKTNRSSVCFSCQQAGYCAQTEITLTHPRPEQLSIANNRSIKK